MERKKKNERCTVLIPALNEEKTIGNCVNIFKKHKLVENVIVIANACDDKTAVIAKLSGAEVIEINKAGKGNAIMVGVKNVKTGIVILCDGDLKNPSEEIIDNLLGGFSRDVVMVKGRFNRSKQPGPVTDMLVKPILELFNHPASSLQQPLSGMVAIKTEFLKQLVLPNDFGVDLFIVLMACQRKKKIVEADLPLIDHRQRDWSHYEKMAREVINVLLFFGLKLESDEKNNNGE